MIWYQTASCVYAGYLKWFLRIATEIRTSQLMAIKRKTGPIRTDSEEKRDKRTSNGRRLEALVAFVERQLVPAGVEVTTNVASFEDGAPLAEFDIEIRGIVGSIPLTWLIECRDRPKGKSAESGAWIEQLHGRKQLHGFSHVTAVSTTGFSRGAKRLAKRANIKAL